MNSPKQDKNRVISSKNIELDARMGGGIPAGSLVLIEGDSGTGKSVLSQQLMSGALWDGYYLTLFTTENSVKSLMSQMQSIDLDVLDFVLLGKFRVYSVELAYLKQQAPFALLAAMKRETDRDVIVVDSFTPAMTHAAANAQILAFFEECKRLCATGTTVIITIHSQGVSADLITPIRSMCDASLRLRTEQDGQRLVKTLEVAKIRGAKAATGAIVGFDVEPGWGMRVIPISKARG